jgi:hypothetical protein
MKLSTLLAVNSVVALAFGIALLLAPVPFLALYGIAVPAGGILVARLFGAELIQVGLLVLLGRGVTEPSVRRAIATAIPVGNALAFVASLLAQLAGTVNALGWSTVVVYLVFTVAYLPFLKTTA